MTRYTDIPTSEQWAEDSRARSAVRNGDPALRQVADLLQMYTDGNGAAGTLPVLGALFFTIDDWLKRDTGNEERAGLTLAMSALYLAVATKLCALYGCTINRLPRELALMFGRKLPAAGEPKGVAFAEWCAPFVNPHPLWRYRLWFRNGRAYQYPWWETKLTKAMALAESRRALPGDLLSRNLVQDSLRNRNYGFFVMDMDREIYLIGRPPGGRDAKDLEDRTEAAGWMRIRGGCIQSIRADGRHGHMRDTWIATLLKALQAQGVALDGIMVENGQATEAVKASDFSETGGAWRKTLAAQGIPFAIRDLA